VHSLALPRSGSGDDSRGGSTGTGSTRGGSRRGRHRTSGAANLSEGGGVPVSAPSLAVSAGRGFDDGRLNAFLAATLLRVVRVAVFLLLLFVALIQVFRAVSTLAVTVLVESVKMLQPAVSMSSARLPRALLRVKLLSVRT